MDESNATLKIKDSGGTAFGNAVLGEKIGFRMKNEIPVAYIDIDFTNGGMINPIKEVVLGPKNNAIPMGISIFLETLGIGNVQILGSEASYR